MAKVAIMGFGTVGSGVYEIIKNKNFEKALGEDVEVKYILDIRDFDEPKGLLTKEFDDILNDDEVTIVAEVMGGLQGGVVGFSRKPTKTKDGRPPPQSCCSHDSSP